MQQPPSPDTETKNSATITVVSARPSASLMPAAMKGIAAGKITFQSNCRSVACIERAGSVNCALTSRTPTIVFTETGNTAARKTIVILSRSPTPIHSSRIGIKATRGIL